MNFRQKEEEYVQTKRGSSQQNMLLKWLTPTLKRCLPNNKLMRVKNYTPPKLIEEFKKPQYVIV